MQAYCVCMAREADSYMGKEKIGEVFPVTKAFGQGSQNLSAF